MNGQNRFFYLFKRMVYRYFADGIPQAAAELSYFLLFSIFPLCNRKFLLFILRCVCTYEFGYPIEYSHVRTLEDL